MEKGCSRGMVVLEEAADQLFLLVVLSREGKSVCHYYGCRKLYFCSFFEDESTFKEPQSPFGKYF